MKKRNSGEKEGKSGFLHIARDNHVLFFFLYCYQLVKLFKSWENKLFLIFSILRRGEVVCYVTSI